MISLQQAKLLEMLPPSLVSDPQVQALSTALDQALQALPALLNGARMLSDISEQPEAMLDSLAWQFHVDEYQGSYALEIKRQLIAQSVYIHQHRGTPAAVQAVISIIFGPGAVLQEWFDYAGDPYHFRILCPSSPAPWSDSDIHDQIVALINRAKNVRSVMDALLVSTEIDRPIYVGGAVLVSKYIEVVQHG